MQQKQFHLVMLLCVLKGFQNELDLAMLSWTARTSEVELEESVSSTEHLVSKLGTMTRPHFPDQ